MISNYTRHLKVTTNQVAHLSGRHPFNLTARGVFGWNMILQFLTVLKFCGLKVSGPTLATKSVTGRFPGKKVTRRLMATENEE